MSVLRRGKTVRGGHVRRRGRHDRRHEACEGDAIVVGACSVVCGVHWWYESMWYVVSKKIASYIYIYIYMYDII